MIFKLLKHLTFDIWNRYNFRKISFFFIIRVMPYFKIYTLSKIFKNTITDSEILHIFCYTSFKNLNSQYKGTRTVLYTWLQVVTSKWLLKNLENLLKFTVSKGVNMCKWLLMPFHWFINSKTLLKGNMWYVAGIYTLTTYNNWENTTEWSPIEQALLLIS